MVDRKILAVGLVAALVLFAGCSGTGGANTEGAAADETATEMEETTDDGLGDEVTEDGLGEETTEDGLGEETENETLGNESDDTLGNETETETSA